MSIFSVPFQKILNSTQIKQADAHSIAHEPIASIDLMERAAQQCTDWLTRHYDTSCVFELFCGMGNNGGDGLAIARQLADLGYTVRAWVVAFTEQGSPDFETNKERLLHSGVPIVILNPETALPKMDNKQTVVIDAVFGSGLSRPVTGFVAVLFQHLNSLKCVRVSIDIPSGLFCEDNSRTNYQHVFAATHTLTLHLPKLALLLPENAEKVGDWHCLPIGLDDAFIQTLPTRYFYLTEKAMAAIFRKRNKFSHKGTHGHALIVAGAKGKMGAAVLATKACLRSGAGLVSVHTPYSGGDILQIAVPEAMLDLNGGEAFLEGDIPVDYAAIGVGPGIGQAHATAQVLYDFIQKTDKPLVLDADALNLIAKNKSILKALPPHSILTPHPKEFERLVGHFENDTHKLDLLTAFAQKHQVIVVLKGAHTAIACPDETIYFNSTGNAGMATAGSGDVLTGIITGLLAQGYPSKEAALLGVYLHGLAGDVAASSMGQHALLASDIVQYMGKAFLKIGAVQNSMSIGYF